MKYNPTSSYYTAQTEAYERFVTLYSQWSGIEDTDGHSKEWCISQAVEMVTEDLNLEHEYVNRLETYLNFATRKIT